MGNFDAKLKDGVYDVASRWIVPTACNSSYEISFISCISGSTTLFSRPSRGMCRE